MEQKIMTLMMSVVRRMELTLADNVKTINIASVGIVHRNGEAQVAYMRSRRAQCA